MPLGPTLWKASEGFYGSLTLAQHGIGPEQDFVRRRQLASAFGTYGEFWKRHVCPATTRPYGTDFRAGISPIACSIAQKSYSVMYKLLDADDSLELVRAGDFGVRYRNWRDAIEAAGNALQLTTELQFAIAGNPKKPTLPSLASQLGVVISPFPDWQKNWAGDRAMALKYRHYLVHEGIMYTIRVQSNEQTLVLGRTAFAAGVNWKHAQASYNASPADWQPLESVCHAVFEDTVAFIDLTYERLIGHMDPLLTTPAYQHLWGWDNSTPPVTTPRAVIAMASTQACSASKTVPRDITII